MPAALSMNLPVQDGELVISDEQRATMRRYLALFDRKVVALKLSKPTSARSLSQNAYYWGAVLSTIAESTAHTTEEIHMALKDMFLPRKFVKLGNREVEIRKTTTDLNTTEFTTYLEQIRAWAANDLGITIPPAQG